MAAPQAGSPEWMVMRLYDALMKRRQETDKLWRYYKGDQPLPALRDRNENVDFQRLLQNSITNVCALVTDAVLQSMEVSGFRIGESSEADADAWRLWQASHMDADSELVFRDMLVRRSGYLMVWPNADDPSTPIISPESERDVIVMFEPGNRRKRVAALKVWVDEWTRKFYANLYTPEFIYKYESEREKSTVDIDGMITRTWTRRRVEGEQWPEPNPLGVVPIIPLINRPDIYGRGTGEFEDIITIQDRVNKAVADLLVSSEFGAFRQRWATGYQIPEDEDGNPIEDVNAAVTRMMVTEKPDTKFGSFDATDLNPLISEVDQAVLHAAAVSQTPPHFFPFAGLVNIGAEALQAVNSALIKKIRSRMRSAGEALEEAIGLALVAAGDERGRDVKIESIWTDPEQHTLAEKADAAGKFKAMGLPDEQIWRQLGFSEIEIARMKQQKAEQLSVMAMIDPTQLLNPPA